MTTQAGRDVFAAIGAQRAEQCSKELAEPKPLPFPKRIFPARSYRSVAGGPVGRPDSVMRFRPGRKLETVAALKRELARQRRRYAPFLRDRAPAMPATRIAVPLKRFDWRLETDADRRAFAKTLAGAGRWETVSIPHYGGPLGRATAYYRTAFTVSSAMRAKGALFIRFKGVDYKAHVFVNGAYLGSHEGFFAPFEFDFTAQARRGRNVLLVKVENDAICMGNDSWGKDGNLFEGDKIYAATGPGYDDPQVGWHHCPPGMGIYQDVSVEARALRHIHDVFVRAFPEEGRAEAWIEVWNTDRLRHEIKLRVSVFGQNFDAVAIRALDLPVGGPVGPGWNQFRFSLDLPKPRLWDLDTPWLYQLQVTLMDAKGRRLDTRARSFGLRSFRMDAVSEPRGRMFLNGREIRLRGANTMGFEQQDVMKKDWRRLVDDILLAKICHINFWRLTQRPVQSEVYDFCDRLGLMTQTDLPLFGVMRRNQFCEAVRQAGEMERLVRAHPCNVMVTYINEPYPPSWGVKAARMLTRPELERLFRACDEAVLMENPDRTIKAVDGDYDPPGPGLPDNHCYCGWYNGHGIPLGRLNKGFWQRVKPGWLYGCGEFGAEGLDPVSVMRKYYPKAWLPQTRNEERTWSPDRIVLAQTGRFHFMWFDTQHALADWVRASQAHQAWVTRLMTESFRRDRRMNTFAIHLFIDAFPAGWMKAIMDVERRPKSSFFAYRDALTPLMVSLRTDRFAYFSGERMEFEAWVCNDTHDIPRGAQLACRLELGGRILAGGCAPARVPRCSSEGQGRWVFRAPEVRARAPATVRLALLDGGGRVLRDTAWTVDVFPCPHLPAVLRECASTALQAGLSQRCRRACPAVSRWQRVWVIGARDGKAAQLAKELGLSAEFRPMPERGPILIDELAAFRKVETAVRRSVSSGSTAIFLELPEGKHELFGSSVEAKACGMGSVQFVSRATGHPLAAGFQPADFRFWHEPAAGYPTPLLERTFEAPGWTPILTSGNGNWKGEWGPALAAAEKREGRGYVRICNVQLAGRVKHNPAAMIFAGRLIG